MVRKALCACVHVCFGDWNRFKLLLITLVVACYGVACIVVCLLVWPTLPEYCGCFFFTFSPWTHFIHFTYLSINSNHLLVV